MHRRYISPTDQDADSFLKSADLKDMARKLPFLWLGTQTVKKLWYKQKFFNDGLTNLGTQAAALYISNVADRNARWDKDDGYRYI